MPSSPATDKACSICSRRKPAAGCATWYTTKGDGWRIPPNPMPPDTPEADIAWASGRRFSQPVKTFEQPLHLTSQAAPPPRTYIYCKRNAPGDVFRQFAERAQREGWRLFEMDSSHNPHITQPQALLAILTEIASAPARP